MPRHRACLAALFLRITAPAARADLTAWLAAVAAGTPAGYLNTGITAPTTDDIGTFNTAGGVSYEFIVNAVNFPNAPTESSALMGARGTGVGDQAGLKFEQWFQSMRYGLTNFGVVDLFFTFNVENADVHLVFQSNTTTGTTELFADGFSQGSVGYAPVLSGTVGLANAWGPGPGMTDPLGGTIVGVAVYDSLLPIDEILKHRDAYFSGGIGVSYCAPAIPNSTGQPGVITAEGSETAATNDVTLIADQLPAAQFGYFLASETQGFFNPPGSSGFICLGGNIGRYNGNVGQGPSFELQIDLTAIPVNPPQPVQAGDTWNFQAWYRDIGNTNNFTDGVSILFQ